MIPLKKIIVILFVLFLCNSIFAETSLANHKSSIDEIIKNGELIRQESFKRLKKIEDAVKNREYTYFQEKFNDPLLDVARNSLDLEQLEKTNQLKYNILENEINEWHNRIENERFHNQQSRDRRRDGNRRDNQLGRHNDRDHDNRQHPDNNQSSERNCRENQKRGNKQDNNEHSSQENLEKYTQFLLNKIPNSSKVKYMSLGELYKYTYTEYSNLTNMTTCFMKDISDEQKYLMETISKSSAHHSESNRIKIEKLHNDAYLFKEKLVDLWYLMKYNTLKRRVENGFLYEEKVVTPYVSYDKAIAYVQEEKKIQEKDKYQSFPYLISGYNKLVYYICVLERSAFSL